MNKIEVRLVQKPLVNPVKFIANATRLTFKTTIPFKDEIKYEPTTDFDKSIVENLVKADHSPLEQISYSVMVIGASRAFLAQITRHRLASYVSASTHYSNWPNANFVVPIEVYEKCEEINSNEPLKFYIDACNESHQNYIKMQETFNLDHGVARSLLPLGFRNNLLITANIREWLSIIQLRACGRNQSEIAYVTWLIRNLLIAECPEIFENSGPACSRTGKCSEGKLCCGHPWTSHVDVNDERWKNVVPLGEKWTKKLVDNG